MNCNPDRFLRIGDCVQGRAPLGDAGLPKYYVVEGKEFSPQYRRSLALTFRRRIVAHVFFEPCQLGLRPERCIFKAANRLLYMHGWVRAFLDIIHQCNCYIISLSRLDVCADFNAFANGLDPREFIRRYFSEPTADTPSYIRHSSNKFRAHGQKNEMGAGTAVCDFQTLSFGTRDSAIQTNLYNKSEELKQKDKPWIRAAWVAAGLDPDNVWRVEFSLNSRGCVALVKHEDGDRLQELCLRSFAVEGYTQDVFLCYASRYFSFHQYYKGETRGLRSVPYADLWPDPDVCVCRPRSINVERNTGRTEMVCYRKLRQLLSEDEFTPAEIEAWCKVCDYFETLAHVKDMQATCARASEIFLADFAYGAQHKRDWFPHVAGSLPLSRIQRLVSIAFADPNVDTATFRDFFVDFLHHAGIYQPESYLDNDERVMPPDIAWSKLEELVAKNATS